ncbi:helix-turn-helix domain-containing protein [Pediococcus parvulus]|uniref:helix-turn-helix domain-containing protein n=1 Tax=Pediococcus parvulus TaxID=54062 RepID=UPI00345ED612
MTCLQELRQSEGLTQFEMAKALKISYSHYSKLEDNFAKPSFKVLQGIKKSFSQTDMNRFF